MALIRAQWATLGLQRTMRHRRGLPVHERKSSPISRADDGAGTRRFPIRLLCLEGRGPSNRAVADRQNSLAYNRPRNRGEFHGPVHRGLCAPFLQGLLYKRFGLSREHRSKARTLGSLLFFLQCAGVDT